MKAHHSSDQAIMRKNIFTEKPDLDVKDLGITPYNEALSLQRTLMQEIIDRKRVGKNITEYLLLVEHPHVYTLGKHANETNLLFSERYYKDSGADVVRIDRGGDVTYHGPGQLVVYPIVDLERHSLGVKDYVYTLEQVVIDVLKEYGISGERVNGATGVWLGHGTPCERKICAIGIRCSRFVTMHGLALNVNTDLSRFSLINPCGFIDKGVTSISMESGTNIDMDEVKMKFVSVFESLMF